MLLQLHHQFADGHTVFLAQTDIDLSDEDLGRKQERDWFEKTSNEYPLPEGAQWMWCTENSEHFVKAPA